MCHQITAEGFGEHASFDGGFAIETQSDARAIFGPHEIDAGRQAVMRSAATFTPRAEETLEELARELPRTVFAACDVTDSDGTPGAQLGNSREGRRQLKHMR